MWVTPKGESNAFATTPFTGPRLAPRSLACRASARVGIYRGSFLDWGDRRLWVMAPPSSALQPVPPSQLVRGSPAACQPQNSPRWLGGALEARWHQNTTSQVGQMFTLPAPRPIRLRVAALITNLGWPPGAIILSSSDYARAWDSSDPSAYAIETRPGVSSASVRSLVQHSLGPETGLTVETAAEREQRHYALASQGLSRLTQIRLLVLIAAVLAVAGAMGAMIWQRRDLVAFIKCQGYRKGVLWRWLLCESAVMLVAGCLIGAGFGLCAQLLGSHFLASVTGFPVAFNVEALRRTFKFCAAQRRHRRRGCPARISRSACASEDSQPGVLIGAR